MIGLIVLIVIVAALLGVLKVTVWGILAVIGLIAVVGWLLGSRGNTRL